MKRRHLLMLGALTIAIWLALFADKTPGTSVVEPVTRNTKALPRVSAKINTVSPASIDGVLALRARTELIGGARENNSSALFGSQNWEPPPPKVVPVKPQRPAPPTAPPVPFTYLGKKIEDGVWEVFLARGEQTYIVHEQALLEGLYRVDAIKPPTLSLTYLPLKQMQTLQIGGVE